MLRRFHVKGFKSLADVEVELAPLVVLFGPNAAGKSNFLEALFLLSRLGTEQTLSAAFEPPLRGYPLEAFGMPAGGLEELLRQDSAELTIEADFQVARSNAGADLRYRIAVRIQPKSGAFEVADEYLVQLGKENGAGPTPRIERLKDGLLVVRELGKQIRPLLQPIGLNHSLVSDRQFSGESRYPDFDQLRRELSAWQTYYLDPRLAMREPQPAKEVSDIGPRGESIAPFLYRLKESAPHRRHFDAIRRALTAAIPTIQDLDVDLDPRRGTLDIVIEQEGTRFSSRVVSEGTLRVLALCCLAANPWPGELIAFEEPENGVHPRRIEVIADLLASIALSKRSQVVVTTHSPTLIAALLRRNREAPDQVRIYSCSQRGRSTEIHPFSPGSLLEDPEMRKALISPEDTSIDGVLLEMMLQRGWLDG